MAGYFPMDEECTIERLTGAVDPDYGTQIETWEVVERVFCNAQDMLPSRSESVKNGLRVATQQTRLRIRNHPGVTATMRVTLHSKGDRVMQIIAGPAMLDDRINTEFVLEGYSTT